MTDMFKTEIGLQVGELSLDDLIYQPLQSLIDTARSSKMTARKLVRRADELIVNKSALNVSHLQGLETLAFNSTAIATATVKIARQLSSHLARVRSSGELLHLSQLVSLATQVTEDELGKRGTQPLKDVLGFLSQLAQDLSTTLTIANDDVHVQTCKNGLVYVPCFC